MSVTSIISDIFRPGQRGVPQVAVENLESIWAELRTSMLTRHAKLFKSAAPSHEALVTALAYQGYIGQDEADFLHDLIDGHHQHQTPEYVVAELRSIADKALTEIRHLN